MPIASVGLNLHSRFCKCMRECLIMELTQYNRTKEMSRQKLAELNNNLRYNIDTPQTAYISSLESLLELFVGCCCWFKINSEMGDNG